MLRQPFITERIDKYDDASGIKIVQLTSYPTPSVPLDYNWPSITPDNQQVVMLCQRWAQRTAPWDIYRCDVDGMNLFQLTQREIKNDKDTQHGRKPAASLTLDGKTVYAVWSAEKILCKIDMETGKLEELIDLTKHIPKGISITSVMRYTDNVGALFYADNGNKLILDSRNDVTGEGGGIIVDLTTGKVTLMSSEYSIFSSIQNSNRLVIQKNFSQASTIIKEDGTKITNPNKDEPSTKWFIDENGDNEEYICSNDLFAHSTLLGGESFSMQGTGMPPNKCIWVKEPGNPPYKLVKGPYFWHSSASYDGEWIIADTNWPDEGLQLIHVPSRNYRTLCYAKSSQGHVQSSHAHPALSQDGRLAVFTSDVSGMSQVYIAHITEEFRNSVKIP